MALVSRPSIPEVLFERIKSDLTEFAFNFFQDGVSLDVSLRTYKIRLKASGIQALDKAATTNASGRVKFSLLNSEKSTLLASEYQIFLVEILAGGDEKTIVAGTLRWSVTAGKTTGLASAADVSVNYLTATDELMVAMGINDLGSASSAASAAIATQKAELAQAASTSALEASQAADANRTAAATSATSAETSKTAAAVSEANALLYAQQAEQAKNNTNLAQNPLGEYNATANSPTLTATPPAGEPVGSWYNITVAGTFPFVGSNFTLAQSCAIGGRIIKKNATQWYYQPPSDLALQKTASIEAKLPIINFFNPEAGVDYRSLNGNGSQSALTPGSTYGTGEAIAVTPGETIYFYNKPAASAPTAHGKINFYNGPVNPANYTTNNMAGMQLTGTAADVATVPPGALWMVPNYVVVDKATTQIRRVAPDGNYMPFGLNQTKNIKMASNDVLQDSTHRFVTDAEKAIWGAKLDKTAVVSIPSKNLLDLDTLTHGVYLQANGGTASSVNYALTAFIPVTEGSTYSVWNKVRGAKFVSMFTAAGVHVPSAYISEVVGSGNTVTFVIPTGLNITQIKVTVYEANLENTQIEVGPPTDWTSHDPVLLSVFGAKVPTPAASSTTVTPAATVDVLNPNNADTLAQLGCSYKAGHGTSIINKHWIGQLQRFTNLIMHNLAVSGSRLTDISQRVRVNQASRFTTRGKGYKDIKPRYATVDNIGNESLSVEVNNSNLYREAAKELLYAVQASGASPVFATDWMIRNPDIAIVLQDMADEAGSVFHNVGVLGDRFMTTGVPVSRWSGSHPDTRGQAHTFNEWKYLAERYLRVRKGMWLGRPISSFVASSIQDYNYDDFDQRARIFTPLNGGQDGIASASNNMIDRTKDIQPSSLGAATLVIDEWLELKTANPVSFNSVAMVELVLDKINNTAISIYVKMAQNANLVPYIKSNFLTGTYAPTSPAMVYHIFRVNKATYDATTINAGDTYTTARVTDGTNPLTLTVKGKYFSPETGYIIGLQSAVASADRAPGTGTLARASGTGSASIAFTTVDDPLSNHSFEFLSSSGKAEGGFESVAARTAYNATTGYYKITLTTSDLQKYVKYDNLKLLLNIPATNFTISDLYCEYSGGTEKILPIQRYKPKLAFTEKLADNAILTGWDSAGKWTNDNAIALKTMTATHSDYPTGLNIASHISLGFGVDNLPNVIRRQISVSPKPGNRKVVIRAVTRVFPKLCRPDLAASDETTSAVLITEDSYDYGYLCCGIKGQNSGYRSPGTINTVAVKKHLVAIGWMEAYFEFDLPALQTGFELQLFRDFKDITGQPNYINHTFDLDVAWISCQVEGE